MKVGDELEARRRYGSGGDREIIQEVAGYIEKGVAEGATALCDGRERLATNGGYFVGPTIFDQVTPEMTIAKEEIFGPVLSVIRVKRWRRQSSW